MDEGRYAPLDDKIVQALRGPGPRTDSKHLVSQLDQKITARRIRDEHANAVTSSAFGAGFKVLCALHQLRGGALGCDNQALGRLSP
jgi:hypothetical protein